MEQQAGTHELILNPENSTERRMMLEERSFTLVQRKAMVFCSSSIVPKNYQGQNNMGNCIIAMDIAKRLCAGELEVMQNLDVIHGNPSFRAKYLIALVNKSGVIKGRLRFRMTGEQGQDSWGCRAYGIDSDTGEELVGTEVSIAMAKAEGWYAKTGSKWKTIPEQMLQYRAAAFWSRVYAPDATMGMHTTDELEDAKEKDITPPKASSIGDIAKSRPLVSKAIEPEPEPSAQAVNTETGEVSEQVEATEQTESTEPESKPSAAGAFTQ